MKQRTRPTVSQTFEAPAGCRRTPAPAEPRTSADRRVTPAMLEVLQIAFG